MTDELKSNLTELAKRRQAIVYFEEQRNLIEAEIEKTDLWKQLEYFRSCIKTSKESEVSQKKIVADDILNAYDGENKTIKVDGEKCGMVKSKTFITIEDSDTVVRWLIEKKLDNLLLPNVSEVKKIAKALRPDGVKIEENVFSPEVKADLSVFLKLDESSDKSKG